MPYRDDDRPVPEDVTLKFRPYPWFSVFRTSSGTALGGRLFGNATVTLCFSSARATIEILGRGKPITMPIDSIAAVVVSGETASQLSLLPKYAQDLSDYISLTGDPVEGARHYHEKIGAQIRSILEQLGHPVAPP
jgi:hypothetical protein